MLYFNQSPAEAWHMGLIRRIHNWVSGISICYRIVIANTLVVAAGALAGAWITYRLAQRGVSPFPIILIALAGTAFSLLLNLALVKQL